MQSTRYTWSVTATRPGLQLGNGWLVADVARDYAGAIGSWSTALDEDADLLIYGCNLAGEVAGQQLIEQPGRTHRR